MGSWAESVFSGSTALWYLRGYRRQSHIQVSFQTIITCCCNFSYELMFNFNGIKFICLCIFMRF